MAAAGGDALHGGGRADSVRLARKSARYNGLDVRYAIREGDFRDLSLLGEDERFDLVLGNRLLTRHGRARRPSQKIACRFELRGDIRDYCAVASAHLAAGGLFACVFPEEQRSRVETAAREAELTIVRRRPVVFKEGEPPLVTLFAMIRSGDLPEHMRNQTWAEPPLVIRAADGGVHREYAAVKLSIGFPP